MEGIELKFKCIRLSLTPECSQGSELINGWEDQYCVFTENVNWEIIVRVWVVFFFLFGGFKKDFILFIYLEITCECAREWRAEGERKSLADSVLSAEPSVGLDLIPMR